MNNESEEIIVVEKRPLTDMPWFRGVYVRIYEIVAMEGRLPPPSSIYVATKLEGEPSPNTMGFAVPEANIVWFREQPPEPWVFAHELVHLARKNSDTPEEVYGYNLSYIIAIMAEKGIIPRRNPLRLFEDVRTRDIINAINAVYRGGFRRLEDFFIHIGVLPQFVLRPTPDEKIEVIEAITELVAGAEQGDPLMMEVILMLLNSNSQ